MSTKKDVMNNLKLVSSLLPLVRTADANGSGVDTENSVGVGVMAHVGAPGDTLSASIYIELELEESDDNITFTDVADADISAPVSGSTNTGCFAKIIANASASAIFKTNYLGNKRYVRVVANVTGTHTNGTPSSASVVLNAARVPVA